MYALATLIFLMSQYAGAKLPLRIYGGRDADPDEYLYVVRLEIQQVVNFENRTYLGKRDYLCTASALTATWTVTAAHCITDLTLHKQDPHSVSKLVMMYCTVHSSPWENCEISDVVDTVPHPLYTFTFESYNHNPIMKNDIGLVETEPTILGHYMKLSAVDYKSLYGHEAVFAGYGFTTKRNKQGKSVTGNTLTLHKPLQIVDVVITKCSKAELLIPSLCMAARCGHNGIACPGDSGGPLVHPSGLVGVLSLIEGPEYCLRKAPRKRFARAGIITPISTYVEWIYSYVGNNDKA